MKICLKQWYKWNPIDLEFLLENEPHYLSSRSFEDNQLAYDRVLLDVTDTMPDRVLMHENFDLFGDDVSNDWIYAVFRTINKFPNSTFMIRTYKIHRMESFCFPTNVWAVGVADEVNDAWDAMERVVTADYRFVCSSQDLEELLELPLFESTE